jgi:hypothetical protein
MEYIMLKSTYDPYLDTVKRNLKDKQYKTLIKKQKDRENIAKAPKSFFSQEINLSDYIDLSESILNTILLSAFILVPYITGILFIFLIIAKANFETFTEIKIDKYFVYWSVGYEVLAFISIMLIIKSAMSFKRR